MKKQTNYTDYCNNHDEYYNSEGLGCRKCDPGLKFLKKALDKVMNSIKPVKKRNKK